jgi:hypothetical protein
MIPTLKDPLKRSKLQLGRDPEERERRKASRN